MSRTEEKYEYLPLERDHIRILHLRPGEEDDSIFIEITREKLELGMEDYSALSWQWGDGTPSQNIRIKNNGLPQICFMKVRRNLLAALKQLRNTQTTLRLWVDAICIDQASENNSEKSVQISLMTKIYGRAKEVCVWLGEAGDDSSMAMQFVNKLVNLDDENHIAGLDRRPLETEKEKEQAKELDALIKLLKRGWFSRRWVVQEIAMARRATLHCGSDSVAWSKLADAIALLEKVGRDGTINRTLKKHAATENRPAEYVGSFSSLPAYRLVQNTTGMFRGQDKKDIRTWRYTLEELVSFLAAFQASRLHDTIYALLGLSSDVKPAPLSPATAIPTNTTTEATASRTRRDSVGLRRQGTVFTKRVAATIEVNYSLPPLEVFKEFLKHAINRSQSLDIICRPWAPESGFDALGRPEAVHLPSWIPSLKRKPFQPTRHGDMVRCNPDPLVGPASFRHRFYSASGLEKPTFRFVDGAPELEVEGFELGVVARTWDAGSFGNVPAVWLTAGGWRSETEAPPDELWRALVADRNAGGDDPDRWYPMVFQSAAKDRRIDYGFETHRLIHESTNAMVAELFRRVQAVVWNRKLMRVTGGFADWLKENEEQVQREDDTAYADGNLGAGPGMTGAGDMGAGEDEETEVGSGDHEAEAGTGTAGDGKDLPGTWVTEGERTDGEEELVRNDTAESDTLTERDSQREELGGALGLSPRDAQIGDLVCIIFGCSVPLVLRKIGATDRYTLIGECYLDHTMDGEAMTYFEKKLGKPGKKKEGKKFILR